MEATHPWPRVLRYSCIIVLIVFGAGGAILAATLPYHNWDAFIYGEWSRQIAETGSLFFRNTIELMAHRPLFYVTQGWLWRIIGFDERYGRLLAFTFTILLAFSLFRLAGRGARGLLAVTLLCACQPFAREAFSGQTDIPVAALLAAAGALLWHSTPSPRANVVRLVLLTLVAAAAGLVKPSAFASLFGLSVAALIDGDVSLKRRVLNGVAPIAGGTGIALLYHLWQAGRFGLTLYGFLTAGLAGYYEQLAAQLRAGALLSAHWLGAALHLLLLFSLIYALARLVRVAHQRAVVISAALAFVAFWIGPMVAKRWLAYAPDTAHRWSEGGYALVLFIPLVWLAARCPQELTESRAQLARLLVWALFPLAAWARGAPYEMRLLSPAWPPLFMLIVAAVAPAFLAAAREKHRLALVPLFTVCLMPLSNFQQLDGVNLQDWRRLAAMVAAGKFDEDSMRSIMLPTFNEALLTVRKEIGRNDRLFSSDGRFRFFFPDRTRQGQPKRCRAFNGYRLFILWKSVPAIYENEKFDWQKCEALSIKYENSDYAVLEINHRDTESTK